VPTGGDRPVWYSIRTTVDHPLGQWHYVENRDGFRELYDIGGGLCYEWTDGDAGDPCEMTNLLAGDVTPEMAELSETLATELAELKVEVAPAPVPRAAS